MNVIVRHGNITFNAGYLGNQDWEYLFKRGVQYVVTPKPFIVTKQKPFSEKLETTTVPFVLIGPTEVYPMVRVDLQEPWQLFSLFSKGYITT